MTSNEMCNTGRAPSSAPVLAELFAGKLVMNRVFPSFQGTRKYNPHYDDVRGDVFRPPRSTTPAAVKIS